MLGGGATCPHCRSSEIEYDSAAGNSVCVSCGAVVEENAVVAEVTFAELSNGASVLEGQFISAERGKTLLPTIFGRRLGDVGRSSNTEGPSAESREMTLANGRRRIQALAGAVGLHGEHYADAAHRWYALALQHQFTRGRRGPNVIAACLYIVCRQERTPHMLLDFADVLSTSVYSLGGTFLRLVRLLNLEMPIVDPSFFVARFAARLEFGEKTNQVANTALRVVARMKRDWIQTGRRPAGVCAAGLIVAARMHGFRRTEAEVVRVVRVCEATLKKRLEEFGRTPSSQLTPQEFEGIWLEQEADPPSFTHTRPKPAEPDTIHILPSVLQHLQQQAAVGAATRTLSGTLATVEAPTASREEEEESEEEENPSLSDVDIDEEMHSILLDEVEVALKTRYWTEMNRDYLEREAEKARVKAIEQATRQKEEDRRQAAAAISTATPVKGGATLLLASTKEGYEETVNEPTPPPTPPSHDGLTAAALLPLKSGGMLTRKRARAMAADPSAEKENRRRLPSTNSSNRSHSANTPLKVVPSTAAEATKQVLQTKRFSKKINYEALDELFTATAASIITSR